MTNTDTENIGWLMREVRKNGHHGHMMNAMHRLNMNFKDDWTPQNLWSYFAEVVLECQTCKHLLVVDFN